MKNFMVIYSLFLMGSSCHSQSTQQYGVPPSLVNMLRSYQSNHQQQQRLNNFAQSNSSPDGPKVYKHISIHIPPKEEEGERQVRVIRPMVSPDKHVNIIFVKAPSASSSQRTEVILPEQPQQRTVVYVLLKQRRPDENNIRIRQPPPTKAPRPEVFFIRYAPKGNGEVKGQDYAGQNQQGYQGQSFKVAGGAEQQGLRVTPNNPRPQYGLPQ